jgi:sirohydrochlorin ferrochelatase
MLSTTMPLPPQTAVILVDHGSTRQESNSLLLEVAAAYRDRVGGIVEPAHMELAEPTIGAAFARCVAQGAKKIVVVPYFLGPGKHWTEDIPRLAAGAAAHHPDVEHAVAAPLGLHPLMLEIIDARMTDALYP